MPTIVRCIYCGVADPDIKSICPADAAPLDEKLKRIAGDGRTSRTKAKVA